MIGTVQMWHKESEKVWPCNLIYDFAPSEKHNHLLTKIYQALCHSCFPLVAGECTDVSFGQFGQICAVLQIIGF